jgi:phage terminase large subunit-like protein
MARRKTPPTSISADLDPVTRYASRVVAGEIVAGPDVRNACARHLRDLATGGDRGLVWDLVEVDRVIGFFRDVLTVEKELLDESGETVSEAVPFVLEPSQEFIVGSLFGWKNRMGLRRFRRAYVEIGKGNGKSPMAAGIGHYMLSATKKLRAEVYSAATDKDQAAILFRDAVEMWRRSHRLSNRLVPSGQNPVWQLTHIDSASYFKPISSEKKGKSGIRPYCALIDEVHEHPDNSVIEMLRAGTKGNQQALIFEITNSGSDPTSVCGVEHEYAVKVAAGDIENDAFFAYICSLDPKDEPFEDERCWIKANPLIGVSIQPDFIREQVAEARGMPSKENIVRRLHFCQWTDAITGAFGREAWRACEADLKLEDYAGEICYGGLDLSYTIDLSAFALAFPVDDEVHVFVWFWKPQDGVSAAAKRDRVPYDLWAKNGYIELVPGKVIELGPVARRMQKSKDNFQLQGIAWDEYRHKDLQARLTDLGIELPLVPHPQGFRRNAGSALWMPRSFEEFENLVTTRKLKVAVNPVLRWNAACTVAREDTSGAGNRMPDKFKSTGRIDGIVAAVEAVGLCKLPKEAGLDDWLGSVG